MKTLITVIIMISLATQSFAQSAQAHGQVAQIPTQARSQAAQSSTQSAQPPAQTQSADTPVSARAAQAPVQAQSPHPGLTITHLTGDLYIYTTWHFIDDGPYPANSMYLVTPKGAVMFDTPWDSTQFQPLLDSIYARHGQRVVLCISTHFHADRTAGLAFLQQQGIATWSSAMTLELCRQRHEHQATYTFTQDTTFTIGDYSFRTFYPGPGHTKDNIVIWLPKDKVLYGGCLVKSTEASTIGNVADGDLIAYPTSIMRLMKEFPHPAYIIPGHLGWTDIQSLEHTLKLCQQYKESHP
jgi:metallo-beta-lactamase class B